MNRQRMVVIALVCVLSGCGGGGGDGGTSGPNCPSKNPLDVAGTYNISATGVDSSTCPFDLTAAIEDGITGFAGTETFTQEGSVVNLEPGIVGCVDDQGNVEASVPPMSDSQNGCRVSITGTVTMNLQSSPSHGKLTIPVHVSSGCNAGFSNCTVVVGITVTKVGFAELGAGAGDGTGALSETVQKVLDTTMSVPLM